MLCRKQPPAIKTGSCVGRPTSCSTDPELYEESKCKSAVTDGVERGSYIQIIINQQSFANMIFDRISFNQISSPAIAQCSATLKTKFAVVLGQATALERAARPHHACREEGFDILLTEIETKVCCNGNQTTTICPCAIPMTSIPSQRLTEPFSRLESI